MVVERKKWRWWSDLCEEVRFFEVVERKQILVAVDLPVIVTLLVLVLVHHLQQLSLVMSMFLDATAER